MDGWVGHVGWPIAHGLTTKWSVAHPASSLAQGGESSPAETSVLTTMLRLRTIHRSIFSLLMLALVMSSWNVQRHVFFGRRLLRPAFTRRRRLSEENVAFVFETLLLSKDVIMINSRFCFRMPRAGSGAVRIDPLRFLAGCHTRWLNHALSVLSLSLDFLGVSVVLLTRAPFWVVLFCVICVFSLFVVLVRLSVPVQVTDWKDSSPKWSIMCWWGC